jgi:UDP-N-acetylglucosamine acyltransferase
VQDGAIISGNSAIHHFTTVGTLSFVGGMSKVVQDIPPFMMADGVDQMRIKTINAIGLRRNGMSEDTIRAIKLAHKVLFRKNTPLKKARATIIDQLGGVIPLELSTLFSFLEDQSQGKVGRAREVVREPDGQVQHDPPQGEVRRAA